MFAVLSTLAGVAGSRSAATVEANTAPSLIAVQDVLASVAEADAAATVVHLSLATGEEDRSRRNLYLEALRRSTEQNTEVARLVGDDDASHEALRTASVGLTSYAGLVERARTTELGGGDGADHLRTALDVSQNDVSAAISTVSSRSQDRFDDERNTGNALMLLALVVGAIAVAALVWLQVGTFRRSRRILNPAMVAATVVMIALVTVAASGTLSRSRALSNAESGGYDSIASTARVQSSAFALHSELSLRLITGEPGETDVDALIDAVDADVAAIGDAADSARERAAADELATRWERYRETAGSIIDLQTGGDGGQAIDQFRGAGLSTFNGLNTTLESVLSDNRAQFADGVASAADSVRWLPAVTIVGSVLAALGLLGGLQRRLGDFA